MDIFFAIATTMDEDISAPQTLTLKGDSKTIHVPIIRDKALDLRELYNLRDTLHNRIDSVFDLSIEEYRKNSGKKTVKVFNCFGDKPEMIEVEIDD